ncbi:hypothetical protein SRHO_G00140160 [Serrasalmus rhombeus]
MKSPSKTAGEPELRSSAEHTCTGAEAAAPPCGTSSRRKVTLLAVQCAEAANIQQDTAKLIGRRTAAAPPPLYPRL